MKKFIKITGTVFVLLLTFCLIFSFADKGLFYRIWYFGDRITVNLYATVDGEQVDAKEISVVSLGIDSSSGYVLYENTQSIKITDNEDCSSFSIKADSYGDYDFLVMIGDYKFQLGAYQWNWWDVQTSDLHIDIDTEKKQYKTYETYTHISEETGYRKVNEAEPEATYNLDEINYLSVCSKS